MNHDWIMWLLSPFFSPVLGMDPRTIHGMLPLSERRTGADIDASITNRDMAVHFEDYPIEELKPPVLLLHARDDRIAPFAPPAGHVQSSMHRYPDLTTSLFPTGGHLIAGHGRFGRVINAMVTACGYKTTVIDHNAATVAGYKRFGVETYFGDASRQELLLIAGLAEARLLVVAIDNHEQAMKITEFARKTNPGIKIVARSYDAQQTYELYHAGADEIVRENFDSAVRCGKRALECLGMPKLKAEEVGNLYFHRNRHGMAMAAKAYDPSIGMFENKALIEIMRAEMAETERLIRQLLHDQAISWPKDVAETTTEHGDMNMQEPVEGG